MEVDFTTEQEAQLLQIASRSGQDAGHWVKDVALRAVEQTNRFRVAVQEGIAQADRNELIDDEEVRNWLETQEHV